jgi:hypothetical protein
MQPAPLGANRRTKMAESIRKFEATAFNRERQALLDRMLTAISNELDPNNVYAQEEIFTDLHLDVVREAIAALATLLLTFALEDGEVPSQEILDEFVANVRADFLGTRVLDTHRS